MRQSQGKERGRGTLFYSGDVASDRSNEEAETASVWGPLAPPIMNSWKYHTLF